MQPLRSSYAPPGGLLKLALLSDLHIGAAACDDRRIRDDLTRASSYGCRVLIAGDVFDAIFHGDKRFSPSVIHPKLRGRDDVGNAALDLATGLLEPFASMIEVVGDGNHETKFTQRTGIDLVGELCRRLNIQRGGYGGVVTFRVGKHDFNVGYWHGAGGGSSIQAAAKQSARLLDVVEGLDVAWTGHRHQRFVHATTRFVLRRGRVTERRVLLAMSGAYTRWEGYAAERMLSPGDAGAVFLVAQDDGAKLKTEAMLL